MSADTLRRFYDAFKDKDGKEMAKCYAPGAHFSDPVFPDLNGVECGAMWRMLCERGKDMELTYSDVESDGATGSAKWEARYTFSKTGRKVHNVIEASFRFDDDGLIVWHADRFGFWRWARMALGASGIALGWSNIVQGKVRAEAAKGLSLYMKRHRINAPEDS